MGFLMQQFLPRGIRNNNPCYIRRNKIDWEGMRLYQSDPDFVQFVLPQYGFRAMAIMLHNYKQQGFVSVSDLVNICSPFPKRIRENYESYIAERLDVLPDSKLDLEHHMPGLLKAIVNYELGPVFTNHYSEHVIEEGLDLGERVLGRRSRFC